MVAVIHLSLITVHLSQVEVSLIQHIFSECPALVLRIRMLGANSFLLIVGVYGLGVRQTNA